MDGTKAEYGELVFAFAKAKAAVVAPLYMANGHGPWLEIAGAVELAAAVDNLFAELMADHENWDVIVSEGVDVIVLFHRVFDAFEALPMHRRGSDMTRRGGALALIAEAISQLPLLRTIARGEQIELRRRFNEAGRVTYGNGWDCGRELRLEAAVSSLSTAIAPPHREEIVAL